MSKPPPRNAARPEPGWYLVRLVSKGWQVPARVWRDGEAYRFEIDGTEYPPLTADDLAHRVVNWLTGESADPVTHLLMRGHPCDQAAFDHRNATREWARQHRPTHPANTPMKAIDTRLLRPEDF